MSNVIDVNFAAKDGLRHLLRRAETLGLPAEAVTVADVAGAPMPLLLGLAEQDLPREAQDAERARTLGLHSKRLRIDVTVDARALPGAGRRRVYQCALAIDLGADLRPAGFSVVSGTLIAAIDGEDRFVSVGLGRDRRGSALGYTGLAGRITSAIEAWAMGHSARPALTAALTSGVEIAEEAARRLRQQALIYDMQVDFNDCDEHWGAELPATRRRATNIWARAVELEREAATMRLIARAWLGELEYGQGA